MAENTTVSFRIDESVKQEWEEAAERPEYNSLSHLIRLSVQREISSEGNETTSESNPIEASSEITQSLTRLERSVEEIQDEVEALGREADSEELYDLKQVLLEILPTAPGSYNPGSPHDVDHTEVGETPRDIAGRIGADTSEVTDALEGLTGSISNVRERSGYYWRVED